MSMLHQHVREVLTEYNQSLEFHGTYNYEDLGVEPIYRGLVLKVPYYVSREVRKLFKFGLYSEEWDNLKGTEFTEKEIAESFINSLHGRSAGIYWTKAARIAGAFAKPELAKPRSHTYSIVFQAMPTDVGFMPDEGMIFWDEAEWRQPKGTMLDIIGVSIFMPASKDDEGGWKILWASKSNPIKIPA